MRKIILTICVLLFTAACAYAQINDEESRRWNQPVKPFKVIGNVYYVGATEVSAFLITTSEGHILLDSGFLETVPQIQQNVAQLGFRFEDIKILLNSHAHSDHAGGLARLKELTGAKLMVSEGDVTQLARGGKDDPNFGDRFLFSPVTVDRTLRDGDTVKLGDVVLTARLTPGHTKGCTTWIMKVREGAKLYDVAFVGSTTAPGYKLVGNDKYPDIVQDYEQTFRLLKNLPVDVYLAAHGSAFGLIEKIKLLGQSAQNPFIDPAGFKRMLARTENQFHAELKRQQGTQ